MQWSRGLSSILVLMSLSQITNAKRLIEKTYFSQYESSGDLKKFGSCRALKEHLSKLAQPNEAFEDVPGGEGQWQLGNRSLEVQKKGSWPSRRERPMDLSASPSFGASGMAMPMQEMKAKVDKSAPDSITGTNIQNKGVDEADFVKFNGQNIFQIHQGSLKILKAWPATEMNIASTFNLEGQPLEMLIYKQNVVVLANSGQRVIASIIDVANPRLPKELTRFEIPGQYMTARLIGGTLRVVNRDYNHQFWRVTEDTEEQSNGWMVPEVRAVDLSFDSTVQVLQGQRRTLDTLGQCENVYSPEKGSIYTLSRISSIDLEAKKYRETLAFVNPQILYASEQALYFSESGYKYQDGTSTPTTTIHKFNLVEDKTAEYEASGTVNGNLINQFAMDEYKGNLRVATNGGEWSTTSWWNKNRQWSVVNRVQVLAKRGQRLEVIGKTDNLAKGERLYSVRFDDDKGYLVTFRQVDPLFTIDLSNPYSPRAVGELKIPGFSTYIHPIGAQHLLAIGQDADPNTGRAKGLKLSIFDVSNFRNPKEVKNLIFKNQTQSEASYEHKAFTYYDEKGALAIPVSDGSRSAILLFKVTNRDLEFKGEMNMSDQFTQLSSTSMARRSFFADDVIYGIGDLGVKAARIASPSQIIGSVSFTTKVISDIGW